MTTEEYEYAIGKLMLAKLFITQQHHEVIDDAIESLQSEYIDRHTKKEL